MDIGNDVVAVTAAQNVGDRFAIQVNEFWRTQQTDDIHAVGQKTGNAVGETFNPIGIERTVGIVKSIKIRDGIDIVGQVVQAARAATDGFHQNGGVLIDDGFLAVVPLRVHANGQDADNGDEGDADDRQTDGNLDHGEAGSGTRDEGRGSRAKAVWLSSLVSRLSTKIRLWTPWRGEAEQRRLDSRLV